MNGSHFAALAVRVSVWFAFIWFGFSQRIASYRFVWVWLGMVFLPQTTQPPYPLALPIPIRLSAFSEHPEVEDGNRIGIETADGNVPTLPSWLPYLSSVTGPLSVLISRLGP